MGPKHSEKTQASLWQDNQQIRKTPSLGSCPQDTAESGWYGFGLNSSLHYTYGHRLITEGYYLSPFKLLQQNTTERYYSSEGWSSEIRVPAWLGVRALLWERVFLLCPHMTEGAGSSERSLL